MTAPGPSKEADDAQGLGLDGSDVSSGACALSSSSAAASSSSAPSSSAPLISGDVPPSPQLYPQPSNFAPGYANNQLDQDPQQQHQQQQQPVFQQQGQLFEQQLAQLPHVGSAGALSASGGGGGGAPLVHHKPGLASAWRLKVVGISEGYSEEQLRSLFSLCGQVVESRIVHDKQSGRPVGYGYVSFSSKEAADLAISTFDDQLQLQGAATFLSVYYAKKQLDTVQEKESCPARNAKLYFCGTPAGFRRDSILALFSAFGRVRHLQVYTDGYGVLSSGTVTMYSTEEATAAMNSLDGKVLQPGTAPLKVTWAQLSTLPRRHPAGGGPPPSMPKGFTVSYACIPTAVTPSEVAARFERYGLVLQVVPFAHRREGPPNSRGCGLVVLESEAAAAEAVEDLSGKFIWPGAERPLLVQPFYGAERVGPHQLPTLGEPGGASGSGGSGGGSPSAGSTGGGGGGFGPGPGRPRSGPPQMQPRGPGGFAGGGFRDGGGGGRGGYGPGPSDGEAPPPGCAPDAFKLLLSNLPASVTQSDIYALLQPYGSVVQVVRSQGANPVLDGAAAVWYAAGAQAEAALAALRNTLLMTPDGPRQLSVTRAERPGGGWGMQQHNNNNHLRPGGMRPGPGPYDGRQQHLMDHQGQGRVGAAAGIIQMAQQQQQQHAFLSHQPQQAMMLAPQHQGYGAGAGMEQQQQGFQQVTRAGVADGGMWAQAPQGAASHGGGLMQPPGASMGAFDMQQLVYMLPQQQQGQPPQQQAVSAGFAPGSMWQAGPGGGQVLLAAPGVTNSGSLLDTSSDPPGFLGGSGSGPGPVGAPVSGPPAAYTGWLY